MSALGPLILDIMELLGLERIRHATATRYLALEFSLSEPDAARLLDRVHGDYDAARRVAAVATRWHTTHEHALRLIRRWRRNGRWQ